MLKNAVTGGPVWCSRGITRSKSSPSDPINTTTHAFVKKVWDSMPMPYTSGQCPVKYPADQGKSDTTTNPSVSNHSLANYPQGNGLVSQRLTSDSHRTFPINLQRSVPYSSIKRWMKPTSLKTCWTIYNARAKNA